jgi:(p)ppGpp synthase/HD superfamily hydrolase
LATTLQSRISRISELSDTIEDQRISPDTIAAQFCEQVAAIVLEVTDDKSLSKEARKAAERAEIRQAA